MNVARVASMRAGLPVQVPAQTVNRFCASGLQAIAIAAERIAAGEADCIVAGGVETMSLVPMGGDKYSANPSLVSSWPEAYAGMGITAELVAEEVRDLPRRPGRLRRREPPPGRRGPGRGPVRRRARPGRRRDHRHRGGQALPRRADRLDADEGVRGDTTAEGLCQAQAGLQGGRDGHRRQRLADDRRRRRGGGGLGEVPPRVRSEAAGPLRLLRASGACRPS